MRMKEVDTKVTKTQTERNNKWFDSSSSVESLTFHQYDTKYSMWHMNWNQSDDETKDFFFIILWMEKQI